MISFGAKVSHFGGASGVTHSSRAIGIGAPLFSRPMEFFLKQRYFAFFPDAWMGESALRTCTSGARGLWADVLCLMNSGVPYGHLTTATGVPITTAAQLKKLVGEDEADVAKWLQELENAQVFSRTAEGVIYCRRMVRDQAGREQWKDEKRRSRGRQVGAQNTHENDPAGDPDSDEKCPKNVRNDVRNLSAECPPLTGTGTGTTEIESADALSLSEKKKSTVGRSLPVPFEPGPTFDPDLEPYVVQLIGLMADVNKSGRIAERRVAAERRHIADRIRELGREAMAHGIREAVRKGAGNVMYAVAAAKRYQPGVPGAAPPTSLPAGPAAVKPEHRDGGWRGRDAW